MSNINLKHEKMNTGTGLKKDEQSESNLKQLLGARENGPSVEIKYTCSNCQYCRSERDECQGVIDYDYFCEHEGMNTFIGHSKKTPEWCPLLPEFAKQLIRECA